MDARNRTGWATHFCVSPIRLILASSQRCLGEIEPVRVHLTEKLHPSACLPRPVATIVCDYAFAWATVRALLDSFNQDDDGVRWHH